MQPAMGCMALYNRLGAAWRARLCAHRCALHAALNMHEERREIL
jgi:hypothetical protein